MNLTKLTQTIKRNVNTVDDLAGGLEALALTIGFRIVSWTAAIPTLILTSRTIGKLFDIQPGAAMLSSVSLELVGQAVVNQWGKAKDWNQSKGKSDMQGRAGLLFASMVVYFLADFVFIGLIEVPKALSGQWEHLASFIFPLMQVISTFVMVERAAQYRREAAASAAKEERRATRAANKAQRRDTRDTDARPARHPDPVTLNKRDFGAWLASLNGQRATLTRDDALVWAASRGMDVSVATGKGNRDKVSRWCREENIV